VLNQRHEFEDMVQSMLEEAMDAGDLPAADPKLAMLQFLNMHNHTFQWVRPGLPWSPSDLSTVYYRTLMLGFGADPATVRQAEAAATRILAGRTAELATH
jgi:TetR/AcrR family transcriptional regulator, cholesterol catabolism regulator